MNDEVSKKEVKQTKKIPVEQLYQIAVELLTKVGLSAQDANTVAECLITADLRGVHSHGILRLPAYCKRVQLGLINPKNEIKIIRETEGIALIDGANGFGHVIAAKAMNVAMKKAENVGIGAVGVFNANHFGMAAHHAEIATNQDMIGIVTCNTAPAMAPWGGRIGMLGTNPICFAIPTNGKPIVADLATSVVARGKIRAALKDRKKIPEGWALNNRGKPTKDPEAALRGTLTPMGGPKGYALAVIFEILSGVLIGAAFSKNVGSTLDFTKKPNVGFFLIAIEVEAFMHISKFKSRVDKLIGMIRSCPKIDGVSEILLPGEPEFRTEEKYMKEGIPISNGILAELKRMLNKL